MSTKEAYEAHLRATNVEGSGKASSYLRALELLQQMLREKPVGFGDCRNIWAVDSIERLEELRERTLQEAKLGEESVWHLDDIPASYLFSGYCSAALRSLQQFLIEHRHVQTLLGIFETHQNDEEALRDQLNCEPDYPKFLLSEIQGKEAIRETKARVNQRAFRQIILGIYGNRCCLTGLDVPEVNRASHIIGWAEREETRMDPRNGLCLSATYDAAFDQKLISFDDDYRLLLSASIKERSPGDSLTEHFLKREGQRIELPSRFRPLREYLAVHRGNDRF